MPVIKCKEVIVLVNYENQFKLDRSPSIAIRLTPLGNVCKGATLSELQFLRLMRVRLNYYSVLKVDLVGNGHAVI